MSLLLLMGDSTPSIGSLFANNEAGLALDVETAYRRGWVYQDSAGATVAAAAGDPVGLILDTAKGGLNSLGSDLVSNGTFATDTVWSKGANWTIGSGVATKTGGAANNLTQTITSTAGLWYRITMDVTRTAGELTVSLGTSGTTRVINASGSYTFYILAGSSTQTLTLAGDSAFAGTVDNVTARLVPGNHAYQTTSGSRPALARTPDGGRRNLLTYTEQFDVTTSGWTKVNVGITANGDTAPDGTLTADKFTETAVTNQFFANGANVGSTSGAGEARTISCYFKAAERSWVRLSIGGSAFPSSNVWFNIGSGAVGTQAGGAGTIQDVGGGWYRCSMTATSSGAGTVLPYVFLSSADNTFSYTGVLGNGAWVWGAQLETGSSATTYQKVGLTSDVTESGKRDCWGLLADGSDDSLITSSVNFSSTDKMTVMAAVRKNSDALDGMLAELTAGSTNQAWGVNGPGSSTVAKWQFYSRGTVSAIPFTASSAYNAPVTNVLSAIGDIGGDIATLRLNGSQVSSVVTDQGSGNYANAAVYILSRSGSQRFAGILYTLIIRGAATPEGTIRDFERNLLAKRAGINI
jgi:hypothetical protein